jgi:carbonic anhydrase
MHRFPLASAWLGAVLAAGSHLVQAGWQSPLSDPEGNAGELWGYAGDHGPTHWGELSPSYQACSSGNLQSPVALETATAVFTPCEPLRFRYRSSSLYIKNEGVGLRLGYDRGSYLVIEGLSYELVELRFHVPGEHAIDGRLAAAELHLIHGNNRGDIAVVAVPLQAGRRVNQTLRRILEHAPQNAGQQFFGRNVGINALFLLPGRKDYFAYRGSLTRPPCTEGVRWYVLRDPVEVDVAEIRRLAQLVGANARPLQPLRGRTVSKSCVP